MTLLALLLAFRVSVCAVVCDFFQDPVTCGCVANYKSPGLVGCYCTPHTVEKKHEEFVPPTALGLPVSQTRGIYFSGSVNSFSHGKVFSGLDTAFSVIVWLDYEAGGSTYPVFQIGTFQMSVTSGTLQVSIGAASGLCSQPISVQKWHHVGVLLSQSSTSGPMDIQMYIDRTLTVTCPGVVSGAFPVLSTHFAYSGGTGYVGYISDMHFFDGLIKQSTYNAYSSAACTIGSAATLCAANSISFPIAPASQYWNRVTGTLDNCVAGCSSCVYPNTDSLSCYGDLKHIVAYSFTAISQYVSGSSQHAVLGEFADRYETADPMVDGSNRGASFDGIDDFVSIDFLANFAASFTLMMWLRPLGSQVEYPLFVKMNSAAAIYLCYLSSQQFRLTVLGTDFTSSAVAALAVGVWAHVTVRVSSTDVEFLINGTVETSISPGCVFADAGSPNGYIGRKDALYFTGFIANFDAFNRYLVNGFVWDFFVYPDAASCSGGSFCPRGSCYLQKGTARSTFPVTEATKGGVCFPCDFGFGCNSSITDCWACQKSCLTCDKATCLSCRAHSTPVSTSCVCTGGTTLVADTRCMRTFHPGLIVWYKFDQVSQRVADYSGLDHEGVLGNLDEQWESADPMLAGNGRGVFFQQPPNSEMPQFLKIDRKEKYKTPYMQDAFTVLAWVRIVSAGSATRQTIFSKSVPSAPKDLILFFIQSNAVHIQYNGNTAFSQSLSSRLQTAKRKTYTVSDWALLVTTYEKLSSYRQVRIFVSTDGGAAPDVDDLTVLDSNDFDDEISPTAVMYLGARMTSGGAMDGFEGYIANFQIWLGAHDIPSLVSAVMTTCTGCSICPKSSAACLPSCPPTQETTSCLACPASCSGSCEAGMCWQCHQSCKTCSGTTSADCLSCRPYMSVSAGGCQCAAGYFLLSSVGRCYQVLVRFDFKDPSEYLFDYTKGVLTTGMLGNFDDYSETENPVYASQSRGLYFHGAQFARVPLLPGSLRYAFSVACFFRDLSTDLLKHTLFYRSSGSDLIHVYVSSRVLTVAVQYTGQTYVTFTSSVPHDSNWHYATATYEKLDEWTRWELFLDGVSVQSQNYYDPNPEFLDLGTTSFIGSTGSGDGFRGFLTAFVIYQGALQAADIAQHLIDTLCGCGSGPCVRPSGACLNLCAMEEFRSGAGVCTKCHVNCGPSVSCEDGASCFDCPETCLTCKYTGTSTQCITCRVMSTLNAGLCTCSAPLSSFPDSQKCYSPWSDLKFGGRAGSFTPDISAMNHFGILGGSIDIYQRFLPPIAPAVMTDDRGVYFSAQGQFVQFHQESPFLDPVATATTFELWVRSTGSGGVIFSVNTGLPSTNTVKLQLYVSVSGYLTVATPGLISISSQLLGSEWNHIATVYEDIPTSATTMSPTITVYVNGLRDFTHICCAKFESDPTSLLLIGARYDTNFFSKIDTFTGFISAIAISEGAAGRFDALRHQVTSVCAAANASCSTCPKSTGVCINTCSATQFYDSNTCSACTQDCADGCYGPPAFTCLECHASCLTCAKSSAAPGPSAATECTSCNVHYAKLDPDTAIVGPSRSCKCQDDYFSAFDSDSKLHCLRLVREYRILEPRYPGVLETKNETPPAWRGDSSMVESADPSPVSTDRGLYFAGNTYVSLLSGRLLLECFTVTVWVRVDSSSANGVLFRKGSAKRLVDNIGLQCEYANPTLVCSFGCSDSSLALCSVSTPVPAAQWFHLALAYEQSLVRTEGTIEVLINGQSMAVSTCGFVFDEEESQPFTFGAGVKGSSVAGFKGMLSLIQVWQGVLYPIFIQTSLLTSACTGPCAGVCTVCPVCVECPMPLCVTCLNPAGCTSCATTSYKDNCDFGFYMDSAGVCQTCTGCQGCSSTGCFKCFRPLCIECVTEYLDGCTKCAPGTFWDTIVKDCVLQSGYFLKSVNPLQIEPCKLSCLECVNSANNCITCLGNMQLQADGSCTCPVAWSAVALGCVQCATHCVKCVGERPDQCVECDGTEFWVMGATECECKPGYYLSNQDICLPCTQRCVRCTFIACTTCEEPFIPFNSICADRRCTSSEFVSPSTNLCTPCAPHCLTCEIDADLCTSCDTTQYYAGPRTCYSCLTTPGFHFPENEVHPQDSTALDICIEICGDGLNYGQFQCDDGNIEDGDGCSSACLIEEGYACSGGTPTSKDSCRWTSPPVGFMELGEHYRYVVSTQPISLTVRFSEWVEYRLKQDYLTSKDVDLLITNTTAFSWVISTKDKQTYTVEVNPNVALTPRHQARLLFFDKSLIRNSLGQPLYNSSLLCNLTDFHPWAASWATIAESAEVASNFHLVFTFVVVAVAVGFHWAMGRPTGTAWRYLEVSQYLYIARLQNVSFPWQLRLFFQVFSWSHFSFLPKLFTHLASDLQPSPQFFRDHGLTSTVFFSNAALELPLLGFLAYLALRVANRVLRLRKDCMLRRAEQQYWHQGIIRSLLLGIPMLFFAAGLQLPSASISSFPRLCCALLSYTCLIGGYAAAVTASVFLSTLLPAQAEAPRVSTRFGLLYEEYKLESAPTRSFLVLYSLRRANVSLALALLYPFPTVQAYALALNSLTLTITQAKIAPYRRVWAGNILNLASDCVLTIAHFSYLGFGAWSEGTAELVGWMLVVMLAGVVGGHFVAMVKDQMRNVGILLNRHQRLTRVAALDTTSANEIVSDQRR